MEAYLFLIEYNHQQGRKTVKKSGTCKGKHERHIYPSIYVLICMKQQPKQMRKQLKWQDNNHI